MPRLVAEAQIEMVLAWDLFMLCDELDMLELRLRELEDVPVRHVITEATRDHHGRPKPLSYADNKERFASWADRIVYNVVTDLPAEGEVPPAWRRRPLGSREPSAERPVRGAVRDSVW